MPVERIRLVMADTHLTPFDVGTVGSRTTPRMAPQLRRVAAAARECCSTWPPSRARSSATTLIRCGRQGRGPERQAVVFASAKLTQGKKLMKVIDEKAPTTPAEKWTVAGTSRRRRWTAGPS